MGKGLLIIILIGLTACTHLFYQPTKQTYFTPDQFKLNYQEHKFKSLDGTELHSWLLPADPKVKRRGLLVHFHGNAQNLSSHFLNLAWVTKEGFDLFIFDYRGYGKSEGAPFQKGVYQDALAAMTYGHDLFKKNQKKENEKFIIYGQSLGGVISLRAMADFELKDKVSLLVLDSTFMSYQDIGFDKLTDHWLFLPLSPLTYLLVSDEYAADDTLDQVMAPTLVIVGEKDRIVPSKFGKKIFKRSKASQKWIWKLDEGQHIDGFHVDQGKYRLDFLKLVDSI
ncbi:MAG: alpha/beta hydrolase [Bacteriovoracaceae bacterium]